MLRRIPARPEQTQSSNHLTQLINDALRRAALAPSDRDALDVTGDALRRLAELARGEVCHG